MIKENFKLDSHINTFERYCREVLDLHIVTTSSQPMNKFDP